MWSHSLFLTPLLALLSALPVLSSPTTPYDPFHDIAVHAPKHPEPPVCCLRPLPALDNTEEEGLLSFEEWKAKQMSSMQKDQAAAAATHMLLSPGHKPGNAVGADVPPEQNVSSLPAAAGAGGGVGPPTVALDSPTDVPAPDAPYSRIPLTDRFNYASTDCSARVHSAHRSAKSASAILSAKKDRYMLSPCAEARQFVVVELCDDIRIDTVQLANYEFFSGVFRDFEVHVAKTYTADTDGWTFAGAYRARNVRGVQSFHPPTTLTDFYRFIRIDFHSHYGSEYYCPLSLLRVYGLTHLEHWKWDMWEAESRAKRPVEEVAPGPAEVVEKPPQPVHVSASPSDVLPKTSVAGVAAASTGQYASQQPLSATLYGPETHSPKNAAAGSLNPAASSPESVVTESIASTFSIVASIVSQSKDAASTLSSSPSPSIPISAVSPGIHVDSSDIESISTQTQRGSSNDAENKTHNTNNDTSRTSSSDSLYNSATLSDSSPSVSVPLSVLAQTSSNHSKSTLSSVLSTAPTPLSASSSSSSSPHPIVNQSTQSPRAASVASSSVPLNSQSLTVVPPPPPSPPPSSSGESIYRTIMNRLTALETNTTLYARFVEDHTASVRDMLRRLSEDVGRLEGIGKAQAQNYQRSVADFQRQQRRLELEHKELISKVVRLTDEVVLEKRLGIAQLCLLLTVLVFMALTRGSRSEPVQGSESGMRSRTSSLWGTRTLSLSGDWVNRLKVVNRSPASVNGHNHDPLSNANKAPGEDGRTAHLKPHAHFPEDDKVDFPSQGVQTTDAVPRSKRPHSMTSPRKVGIPVRPRTPSSARIPRHHSPQYHPSTPTAPHAPLAFLSSARPPIQRAQSGGAMTQSFSMGMIGPVPRSAKRWARTAHLHQVKSTASGASTSQSGPSMSDASRAEGSSREPSSAQFVSEDDVFGTTVATVRSSPNTRDERRDVGCAVGRRASQELLAEFPSLAGPIESDVSEGGWVDTDVEGSDFEPR